MQKVQNKTNKQNKVNAKANKGEKAMEKQVEQVKETLVDKVIAKIDKAIEKDNNIKRQKVTGYISVKYGNKVLFELHAKKKAITHLTFAKTQKVFELLKQNKLILRIVPKSYGWKYDTECLLTEEFYKHFDAILKSVIAEAIEERNLKTKQADKKVAKA